MALEPNNIIILIESLLELVPREKREAALNLIQNSLAGSDEISVHEFKSVKDKFKKLKHKKH